VCISSLSSVRVLVCACMIVGKCVCVLERERLNAHARARKSKEGWAVTAAAEGTAAMHRFV